MPSKVQYEKSNIFQWFTVIAIGFGVIVLILYLMEPSSQEKYSPYRYTTGCPSAVRWEYHKEYDNEDYYKKYPYIYPTPTNYVKAWYAGMRANNKFLVEKIKKMQLEKL